MPRKYIRKNNRYWTPAQIRMLVRLYPKMTAAEVCRRINDRFGRNFTVGSIYDRAGLLREQIARKSAAGVGLSLAKKASSYAASERGLTRKEIEETAREEREWDEARARRKIATFNAVPGVTRAQLMGRR